MSYQLQAGETLGDGVRRVCCDEIRCAIEASKAPPNGKVSAVHATRKHLKRARAALRLMSRNVDLARFAAEQRNLRDVGRLISDVRDAEVRLGTVQQLRQLARIKKDRVLQKTEDLLCFELDSFFAAFSDWKEEAQAKLTGVQKRIAQWHLANLDCEEIRRTVQETYKLGRGALSLAADKPSAENFHEFRKRTKELSYHLRILRPLHPPVFDPLTKKLKVLGEHLGQANDLAFLEERLASLHGRAMRGHGLKKLCRRMDARRAELQATACELGKKLFAKRPRDFARRIAHYFEAWEKSKRRHTANGRSTHQGASRNGHHGVRGQRAPASRRSRARTA
jgi:CHAD domain-containing protein